MYTLKQARRLCEITQKDAAKALGVALPTYRGYERNPHKLTVEQADKLSRLFNGLFEISARKGTTP